MRREERRVEILAGGFRTMYAAAKRGLIAATRLR